MLLKAWKSILLRHSKLCNPAAPSVVPVRTNMNEVPMSSYLTIINQRDRRGKSVNRIISYNKNGFRLQNDSFVFGPILVFENHIFCWNIKGDEEINEESLQFLFHLHPPLDLIVIGYGNSENKDIHKRNLHLIARKHNCAIELMHVEKAVGIYNFLLETRNVAGAFVPPQNMRYPSDNESLRHFFETPDGLDVPSHDAEHNYDMLNIPRYKRVETKKIVSKKKDQKQIETGSKKSEDDTNTETDSKKD